MKKILRFPKLKHRNKSGFTLIEVIVSCALLAVLILAVMAMISPVMTVIGSNEKNANALMIAEAVEAEIDRNIKNSVFCAVFTNAQPGSSVVGTPSADLTTDTGKIRLHTAMSEMLTFLSTDSNMDIYDMKIIGIRWIEDVRTHQYKYMLTSITPKIKADGSGFDSFTEGKVFEDCFYENFFPDIKFETMEFVEHAEDGTTVTACRNVALKTTIDVHSDSTMDSRAASGTGYADFINIRTNAINPDGTYKLYWISDDDNKDAMGNDITVKTLLREDDDFTDEFGDVRPETYVVYVTRKLKYAPPASSSTLSSSSTP